MSKTVDSRLEKLEAAIRNQHLVLIKYHDTERVVAPHALGLGSDKQPLLRVFQQTEAGAKEGEKWRLFRVDRIQALKVTAQGFTARPEYQSPDKAFSWVIAAVKKEGE